jgi:hypothetical protein
MDRAAVRKLPWPELALIACGLLFVMALMFTTSSHTCHQWKEDLRRVSGAFLAGAGEKEYPPPASGVSRERVSRERASLRSTARRVLDERPFGCL